MFHTIFYGWGGYCEACYGAKNAFLSNYKKRNERGAFSYDKG